MFERKLISPKAVAVLHECRSPTGSFEMTQERCANSCARKRMKSYIRDRGNTHNPLILPAAMNYDHILKQVEHKIGKAPRRFNIIDRLTWFKKDLPSWEWEQDTIRTSIDNWERVFTHGQVAWGRIVQVNRLMFEKNDFNCPGEVLVWTDKNHAFDPDVFELAGHKLFELKGYSEYLEEPEEKEYAAYLENEMTRKYGVKVPAGIAGTLHLHTSTVFFQRRYIPDGVITSSLFPVLYLATNPMVVVMVPHRFWPADFLIGW